MPPTETADPVVALTSVIASQAEVIKSQAQTIDTLSGARGKALNLEMKFGDLWERYFRSLPDVHWKKSTKSMMRRFVARNADVKMADFGPMNWLDYRDDPEIQAHYHVTTRNLQLKRLRIFLNWTIATDQLVSNPLQRVKTERGRPQRRTEISAGDEQTIVKDMPPLLGAMFVVAIDSAMRKNETRTLEWSDIDWKTRTVSLPAERTKTKQARTVYLTSRAVEALKGLPRRPGCPYVFANPVTLKPYSQTFIWNWFRRSVDSNGIKPAPGDEAVRWHDARHSAAVRLIRLGAPLPAVKEILGHASLMTTALYLHAHRKDVVDAHALLDKATRKGPRRAPGSDVAGTKSGRRRYG